MKINLKNVCYPKPILSKLVDDYIDNNFNINIINQEYNKQNQTLKLDIETVLSNKFINKLVEEEKIAVILHLEQKTQRELIRLNNNGITTKTINLYKYATTEPIEVIGILYTVEDFEIWDKKILNEIYGLLEEKINYERGDIVGYSNELQINLPEDKRIGSIFNLIPDQNNLLEGQPFKVSLNSELIQILMESEIHKKFISIYKKDQYVKRLVFFNIVETAVITAYTEMFMSYEMYKEKKWCRTLSAKVEKMLKLQADEIFKKDNYDVDKVYKFTNYALGDLFKDAVSIYERGVIEGNG